MPTVSYSRIGGAFSARTKRHTGRHPLEQQAARDREGHGRACPCRRAAGSTQTCCSCTAVGVQADASALNRITPSSTHSHERPSSICDARAPAEAVRVAVAAGRRRAPRSCAAAHAGHEQLEVVERRGPQAGVAGRRRLVGSRRRAGPGRSSRGAGRRERAASHSSETALLLADQHPRPRRAATPRRRRRSREPEGTTFDADVAERDGARAARASADEAALPAPCHVLEEDALDRILGAEAEDLARASAR